MSVDTTENDSGVDDEISDVDDENDFFGQDLCQTALRVFEVLDKYGQHCEYCDDPAGPPSGGMHFSDDSLTMEVIARAITLDIQELLFQEELPILGSSVLETLEQHVTVPTTANQSYYVLLQKLHSEYSDSTDDETESQSSTDVEAEFDSNVGTEVESCDSFDEWE